MADLSVKYLGLDLKTPLIAASSGLTDNIDNLKRFEKHGAGAVVLKSLFEEEIRIEKEAALSKMGSSGFIYPETMEFYDYNDAADQESTFRYLDLVAEAKKKIHIPVIPSINCVTAEQWTDFPKQLQDAGADAIELNIFIIPSDLKRTKEDNEKVYFDIIKEVKRQVTIPVSLKISFYFSDLAIMMKKLSESGIAGLVMFNRFYSPDFDIDTMEVTAASVLSSPGDFSQSLRWISIMRDHVSCDLASSGGVHDGNTLIKMILAGANAVQIASAFYKNGIDYGDEIISSLQDWMKKNKYKNIDEFRSLMSQHQTNNPAVFQRVQFMKYFRGHK
ncbi:MAG: dihydroorotate dehydrogenase-like protein [Bacteroidales bacterium]|nr:dihydroorotate dehydrogenase-like protein [Bacteroidales bacterium]MCB8998597.1 dihydroorotate dehydrogenase-like protein [Bacteroidales bacterium]MCB9012535.1 dihydroorotate dehydrogenase-like protein [Bacteroidales bacterium]